MRQRFLLGNISAAAMRPAILIVAEQRAAARVDRLPAVRPLVERLGRRVERSAERSLAIQAVVRWWGLPPVQPEDFSVAFFGAHPRAMPINSSFSVVLWSEVTIR